MANIIPHSKICIGYSGPEIKKLDLSQPIPEEIIQKIQNRLVRYSPNGHSYPEDRETIPECNDINHCENEKYRHFSRSEAIEEIKSERLILHMDEIENRENEIDVFIIELLDFKLGYSIGYLSSAGDFDTTKFDKYPHGLNKFYGQIAKRALKKYGKPVCSECLREACYLWRQVDVVKKYLGISCLSAPK